MAVDPALADLFVQHRNGTLITLKRDGRPQASVVVHAWDPDACSIRVSLTEDRAKTRNLRRDPRVALTVLGDESWYAHVSLLGRVVSIEDDPDLAGIDRLSIRYYGKPFHSRDARRVTAWMEPHRWSSWPLSR